MIKKKRGVVVKGLKVPMIKPMQLAHDLYQLAGVNLVLSVGIAKRKNKSLHPLGYAIDIRTRDLTNSQKSIIFAILVRQLGNDYDVIMYDTHIHIEYQRVLDDAKNADFMASFLMDDFEEVQ
jgi:hypothetical protein